MKLYDVPFSGNCYKVRLFLALLNVPYEIVPIDFLAGEHKSAAFLALNPFGQVPVLTDGDVVLRDSQAILVYLARRYEREDWLPTAALPLAQVQQWLSIAANEFDRGPAAARVHDRFGIPLDITLARQRSTQLLSVVDQHLTQNDWLAVGHPTIADLACFPYAALAPEGAVPLAEFPAVVRWIERIKAWPSFVSMPGI